MSLRGAFYENTQTRIWTFQNTKIRGMYAVFIPNRTFLVRFGSILGEFGRAMVRIFARRSRAKIPMARPNEPDILRHLPYPNSS